ncbi:MAG: SpoIVB peptidase [Candidatus Limivicinus sp.]|jgi:stage IV sporulation protein B
MKKTVITAACCLILGAALSPAASAQELVVGGQAVGIQVGTDGVYVAGLSDVETAEGKSTPAADAGMKQGDMILKINGRDVKYASQLIETVAALEGKPAELTVQRDNEILHIEIQPVQADEGRWMMGMWLRDGLSGIGTLTFCDPVSGVYGALGHSISDGESGKKLPLSGGKITDAEIVSVTKGRSGAPGELNGCADLGKVLGSIEANTDHGIYGRAYASPGSRKIETGDIAAGDASIVSTVIGREPREYKVEINRVYRDSKGEHAMLTVTDPELRASTGGIVQGMSGSPILQNGRLVGAVTHVFVNDPTRGYGVSIGDMLRSAGIEEQAA